MEEIVFQPQPADRERIHNQIQNCSLSFTSGL